jgi:hypothetical protein
MFFEPITQDELEFLEAYYDPTALTECLVPENIKAPHLWTNEDCKLVELRNYQFAMQNYSYLYADDDSLKSKENFQRKKGAGDLINLAGRNEGKTFLGLIIDAFINLIHSEGDESCIASFDHKHLLKPCKVLSNLINYHPFFQLFKRQAKKSVRFTAGGMEADTLLGHVLYGKNEKVDEPDPGTDFHGLHFKTFWYEETSYMSKAGTEKRIDSGHSEGYIERLSGIPDIRVDSPLGKILLDPKKQNWICRLPQYVREDWDSQSKQEAIEKYNGETSYGFKLNVEAEILEGASGYWDMDRLRKACNYGKDGSRVKFFEIDKNRLNKLDQILILDRLPCKQAYVCSDIGTLGSPSEIIILFYDGEIFKYHYNISLYKLSTFEQAQVFKFIYDKLGRAFIGLDCTNSDGRSILDDLQRLGIPQDDLVAVRFNKNIEVDFVKNDDGTVQLDNAGQPIMKQELTMDWAMQILERLFYNSKMFIPLDEKFLASFSGIIMKQIGTSRKIGSVNGEDHLHQSFQCFAITYFQNEFKQQLAKPKTKRCLGTIG